MLLNSMGQAYATLLFKLLAQRHQQVLRTKRELNVSDSTAVCTYRSIVYAALLFKLLAQHHQQVLPIKKELNVSNSTAEPTCRSIVWAKVYAKFLFKLLAKCHQQVPYCGQIRNYEHLHSQPLRRVAHMDWARFATLLF
jgi:hypothetical protein